MNKPIQTLTVKIGSDIAAATRGMDDVSAKSSKLGAALGKLKGVAIGLAGAAAGLGVAFIAAANKAAEYADEIDKASIRTSISRERLQELRFVADQVGVEFESLLKAVQGFVSRIPQFADGTSIAAKEWQKLGVSLTDGQGNLRGMTDLLTDSLLALANTENATERAALAYQVFGRQGLTMLTIVDQGAEGIARLTERARELGLVMGDEGIADLVAYKDAMAALRDQVLAASRTLVVDFVPVMTDSVIPAMEKLLRLVGEVAFGFSAWVGAIDPLEDRFRNLSETQLDRKLKGIANELNKLREEEAADPGQLFGVNLTPTALHRADDRRRRIEELEAELAAGAKVRESLRAQDAARQADLEKGEQDLETAEQARIRKRAEAEQAAHEKRLLQIQAELRAQGASTVAGAGGAVELAASPFAMGAAASGGQEGVSASRARARAAEELDVLAQVSDDLSNVMGPIPGLFSTLGIEMGGFGKAVQLATSFLQAMQTIQGIGGFLSFQGGGVVPGPIGSPQLAVVHGGERVIPTQGRGGPQEIRLVIDASAIPEPTDFGILASKPDAVRFTLALLRSARASGFRFD